MELVENVGLIGDSNSKRSLVPSGNPGEKKLDGRSIFYSFTWDVNYTIGNQDTRLRSPRRDFEEIKVETTSTTSWFGEIVSRGRQYKAGTTIPIFLISGNEQSVAVDFQVSILSQEDKVVFEYPMVRRTFATQYQALGFEDFDPYNFQDILKSPNIRIMYTLANFF